MRPATVADACHRFRDGEPWGKALGDVHAFYGAEGPSARAAKLAEEPPPLGAQRDALVGGIAEYLFKRWTPQTPPHWIGERGRRLDNPWFPNGGDDPALMDYLTFASPAEFKSRNVMVHNSL